MKLSVMNVTPEMAASWLDKNGRNRRISRYHVSRIADQIASGKWVLNGQTVSFDEAGRLLDGQHRLSAVVESGISVPMAVAVGVTDPEAFKTYDATSLKRGAHQIAQIMGVKDACRVSSCARTIIAYESSKDMDAFAQSFMNSKGGPSPDDVAEKSKEIEPEMQDAARMVSKSFLKSTGAPSVFLAILVILNRINPVDAATFCDKLRTGVVDHEKDPCLVLRDRLLSGRSGQHDRQWKVTMMGMVIKAFNAHQEGRGIGVLRVRDTERFPRINGGKK